MDDRPWLTNPDWTYRPWEHMVYPYVLPKDAGIPGLPIVPPRKHLDADDIQRNIQELANTIQGHQQSSTEDRLTRMEGMLERLVFLLSLSPQERAFLQAIAEGDEVALLVYADWLDDQGRSDNAKDMRKLAAKRAKKKKPSPQPTQEKAS